MSTTSFTFTEVSATKPRPFPLPFPEKTLAALARAAKRINADRKALLRDIPPGYVVTLPVAPDGEDQILCDLQAMNRVKRLTDGSVPMVAWLQSAVERAVGTPSYVVLTGALGRFRP